MDIAPPLPISLTSLLLHSSHPRFQSRPSAIRPCRASSVSRTLHAVHCASALHSFDYIPLGDSTTPLGHPSSPSVLWTFSVIVLGCCWGMIAKVFGIAPLPRIFSYAVGSFSSAFAIAILSSSTPLRSTVLAMAWAPAPAPAQGSFLPFTNFSSVTSRSAVLLQNLLMNPLPVLRQPLRHLLMLLLSTVRGHTFREGRGRSVTPSNTLFSFTVSPCLVGHRGH